MCLYKNTLMDEKNGAQPMKAKSIKVSFQLSFALKDSSAVY